MPWFPLSEYLPGWRKEIFGDSLPQILRIQTLTHTRSHALPPNFNGCIYVAELGQPEAKLEVSCAAHPYYLLKHLQAGSRATLLILPGTKAQEYPEHVRGHQGQGTCQRNIDGFQHHNQGNREQAFFLCSRNFQTQAWTDWGRGGRQEILVTRAKKSVCTRICRLWSGRNMMSWMRKALACSFSCHHPHPTPPPPPLKNPYNVKPLNSGGGSIHLLISKYFLLLCGACWLYCCCNLLKCFQEISLDFNFNFFLLRNLKRVYNNPNLTF